MKKKTKKMYNVPADVECESTTPQERQKAMLEYCKNCVKQYKEATNEKENPRSTSRH